MKILILIVATLATSLFAQTHYVNKTGSSIPPYSSWNTAANSIQDAIDISASGDSILVDEGTYYEMIRINTPLILSGVSSEKVIIDASEISDTTFFSHENLNISGFTFKGSGNEDQDYTIGTFVVGDTNYVSDCDFRDCVFGLVTIRTTTISECVFNDCYNAINSGDFTKSHTLTISNCIFYITRNGLALNASPFNKVVITGNRFHSASFEGMLSVFANAFDVNTMIFKNNQSINAKKNTIYLEMSVNDSLIIENNTMVSQTKDFIVGAAIYVRWPQYARIRNNIFSDCYRNMIINPSPTSEVEVGYNMYWNIEHQDSVYIAESDYFDQAPGFYIPYADYDEPVDLRLEKYSPAINAGDPSLLDKDGTRSDLGAFGGPGGISYEYPVWALPAVTNLEYNFEIGDPVIELNWDSLQVDDLFRYRVYRDTVYPSGINEESFLAYSDSCEYTDNNIGSESRYYYYVVGEDTVGRLGEISNIAVVVLTGVDDDGEIQPTENILYPNYPNPFNPETRINYQLKEESRVLLEILDIKGERVAVLVDGIQNHGEHTAIFNGSDLSSGVYVYRLQIIKDKGKTIYSQGKKMLLLK